MMKYPKPFAIQTVLEWIDIDRDERKIRFDAIGLVGIYLPVSSAQMRSKKGAELLK